MPESAAYDAAGQQVFVSNVNHYAKDGNGFISRVSTHDQTVELRWLDGLDSPTGLAVFEDRLYIANYDELVIVDINSRKIAHRLAAPDALDKPALNDVAISDTGEVFVSGSASQSIYHYQPSRLPAQLRVWKQDDALLRTANGLLVEGDRLIHGGLTWTVFDIPSRSPITDALYPPATLKDFDGITADGCGGYLVTLIDDARLWHIRADGNHTPLSEQAINGIDIQRHNDTLFVPVVGGGLSAYQLSPGCDLIDS